MKKFVLGFIVGALLFTALPIGAAIEEYICYKSDYKVMVNGVEYISEDLPILNYKGYTYAPFRSILEAAGLNVNWNAELRQAEVTLPEVKEDDNMNDRSSPAWDLSYTRYQMPIFMNANQNPPLEKEGSLYCFEYEGTKYVLLDLLDRPKTCPYKFTMGKLRLEKNEVIDDEIVTTILIPEIPYGEYPFESYRFYVTYDYYTNTLLPILKGAE